MSSTTPTPITPEYPTCGWKTDAEALAWYRATFDDDDTADGLVLARLAAWDRGQSAGPFVHGVPQREPVTSATGWFIECPDGDSGCSATRCTRCGAVTHAPAGYAVSNGRGLCSRCLSGAAETDAPF